MAQFLFTGRFEHYGEWPIICKEKLIEVVAMASTRRSRSSNSRASSAIAPIISGAGSSASTNEMTSHSVFAHPRAAGQHLESCPQCSPETEGLHHILPTLTSSRTSPRRSSSLSTDLINSDPSTVIVGCQECHRNSQRSNSRNRRTRRSRWVNLIVDFTKFLSISRNFSQFHEFFVNDLKTVILL